MAPTAPPRFDAPVETPAELAEHTPVPATPPAEAAVPPPPQGEVELIGRVVDNSLLDALVEMHNPTEGGGGRGESPCEWARERPDMENP